MYPSEDFTNANWDQTNCTITANDTTSPDGTQNADKLTTTSTSGENEVRFSSFSIVGNVGSSYTTTVYAKKGTANFLRIRNLFVQNGGTVGNAWFNLNTGAVATVQSSQTASIENVGNGWYRCVLTGVVGAAGALNLIDIGFTDTDATNYPTTSVNGYFWGAQAEASSYPTSYIPTTTASATRVADACYKTGISSLIGQTEGVLFAEFDMTTNANSGAYQTIINIATDANNSIDILKNNTTSELYIFAINGGVIQVNSVGIAGTNILGRHKIALAYKSNDYVCYLDGVQVFTDTSASVPACSNLYLGAYLGASNQLGGTIGEAVLFPTRLTNAELASLTTI